MFHHMVRSSLQGSKAGERVFKNRSNFPNKIKCGRNDYKTKIFNQAGTQMNLVLELCYIR